MNSKEQFGQLVMKYKESLFFTAKSILRNDTDAEDAVCSAIMKAFENFSQLREQQYFKSWITRIVINEAYAICRKNKNLQSMEEMTTEPAYSDYHDEMWEIVNTLDEEFRTVIIMFYYNDIPINEIAEYLDIAPGTVKSRLNRGRKKLKELITL
ncbi:MAG: sigma-70 family RNA polymerase sigma factor [Oscillospiraceae bacterium]|uniref:sigma-70 family RNA polymerase sigma factor n=1 Tax=Ruminococcus sp. HUN007 TaxID=1514668 RepID=UPI0005D1DBA6|nr:sigma-70 family RNA polymerase sigma factor [Ruminococcus sp. HUN007]MBQ5337347.1 sigma-70 family RNA polymerase sigma factor [Oscillospiraceae bacterium]